MSFALSVSKRDAAWPAAALAAFVFCPAGLPKFFFLGVGIWLAKRLAGDPASSFRKNFPLILFLIEMRKLRPDARFALANTPLELAGRGNFDFVIFRWDAAPEIEPGHRHVGYIRAFDIPARGGTLTVFKREERGAAVVNP